MAGKLVDAGENRFLNILLGATAVDSTLVLGLYKNSSEPAESAVLGDLTQPSGGGYSTISLSRGSWSITGSGATYAQQTFTPSGADWGNCYGYFIAAGSVLLFVENFSDGPYNVTDGDLVKITPSITAS